GGVENRARPEDRPVLSTGDADGELREHIDRVGDHEKEGLWGNRGQLGDHAAEDPGVASRELEPRLPGPLLGAGRDDDDVGAFAHRDVGTAGDRGGPDELESMAEVERLSVHLLGVEVVERDVVGDPAIERGEGNRGPYAPGTD